jgi:hypothetical protein
MHQPDEPPTTPLIAYPRYRLPPPGFGKIARKFEDFLFAVGLAV